MSSYGGYSVGDGKDLSSGTQSNILDVTGSMGAGGHGHRFSQFFKNKNKRSTRDLQLAKLFAKIQTRVDRLAVKGGKLEFSDLTTEFAFLLDKINHLIEVVRDSVEPLKRILYLLSRSQGRRRLENSMLKLVIERSDRVWLAEWHSRSLEMHSILERLHGIITEQLNSILVKVLASYRKILNITPKHKRKLGSIFRDIEDFKNSYDIDYCNFESLLTSLDDVLSRSDLYLKMDKLQKKLSESKKKISTKTRIYSRSKKILRKRIKTFFENLGIHSLTVQCRKLNQKGLALLHGGGGREQVKEIERFLSEFSGYVKDLKGRLSEFEGHASLEDLSLDQALKRCMKESVGVLASMSRVESKLKGKVNQ
jgi:hypothetical protein